MQSNERAPWARWHLGDREGGLAAMRRGIAACHDMGNAIYTTLFETALAEAEAEAGEIEAALASIDHAVALTERCYYILHLKSTAPSPCTVTMVGLRLHTHRRGRAKAPLSGPGAGNIACGRRSSPTLSTCAGRRSGRESPAAVARARLLKVQADRAELPLPTQAQACG
jgi:hypothetical protein